MPIGGLRRSPSEPSTGECDASHGANSAQNTSAPTIASGTRGGQRRSGAGRDRASGEAVASGVTGRTFGGRSLRVSDLGIEVGVEDVHEEVDPDVHRAQEDDD